MTQTPRLMRGGLSGRVYVVTRYRELGNGTIEALDKHDVHADFLALVAEHEIVREYAEGDHR